MQKRFLGISLAVIIFLLLFSTVVGASEARNYNVKVFVNETEIIFDDNTGRPYINKDNRTMLPFRKVAEAAKAEVQWVAAEQKAVATNNANTVEMIVGKKEYWKNGKVEMMDTEMILDISESRTYAPFRAISEGLGYQVDYTRVVQKSDNKEFLAVFNFTQGQSKEEQQNIIEEVKNRLQGTEAGLSYEGNTSDGKANGFGKLYKNNQLIYEGIFANDLPHGDGVLLKDGLVHFKGIFVNGEPNKGVIFNADGSKLFDGSISYWNDESFIGEGQLYADNKVIYQGELIIQGGGIALGNQGSLFYDSGELYFKGDLYGDTPFGKGIFYNKDGSVIFEGEF
ncbi:hypothetical protein ASZ90_019591 [hydrocarbon metagenome]|uniref:Copper amine oxidase-like N-terminal domain-containing protein n=1 Tax=hydrocarbon metagenome TaxID=938273 RepID=A0A0W8E304_9ZZZZ